MFIWNKYSSQKVRKRLRQELDRLRPEAEDEMQTPTNLDDESDFDGPSASRRTAQLLRAFHQIETGEYGRCTNCGEPIESAHLEDDVAASTCEACEVIAYR